MPRWLWGLLRQARLPQFGQHSEFTSVLAARAQGQEIALLGRFPFTRPNEQIRAAALLDIVGGAECGNIPPTWRRGLEYANQISAMGEL